jgi:hypothetical protein
VPTETIVSVFCISILPVNPPKFNDVQVEATLITTSDELPSKITISPATGNRFDGLLRTIELVKDQLVPAFQFTVPKAALSLYNVAILQL